MLELTGYFRHDIIKDGKSSEKNLERREKMSYNSQVDPKLTRKGRFTSEIGQSTSIESVLGRLEITESNGNIFLSINPRFVGHGHGLHEFIPQSLIGKKVSVRWSGEGIIIQPKE